MADIEYEKTSVGYLATLGPFTARARNKTLAKKALFDLIAREPENTKPYLYRASGGEIWILYRYLGAWGYETPSGCFCVVNGTRDETINALHEHAAQVRDARVKQE